jgi:hypothetical protein
VKLCNGRRRMCVWSRGLSVIVPIYSELPQKPIRPIFPVLVRNVNRLSEHIGLSSIRNLPSPELGAFKITIHHSLAYSARPIQLFASFSSIASLFPSRTLIDINHSWRYLGVSLAIKQHHFHPPNDDPTLIRPPHRSPICYFPLNGQHGFR